MVDLRTLEIRETAEDLQRLFCCQTNPIGEDRIVALLLAKIGRVSSVLELSHIIGQQPATLCRWLRTYQADGLDRLLSL